MCTGTTGRRRRCSRAGPAGSVPTPTTMRRSTFWYGRDFRAYPFRPVGQGRLHGEGRSRWGPRRPVNEMGRLSSPAFKSQMSHSATTSSPPGLTSAAACRSVASPAAPPGKAKVLMTKSKPVMGGPARQFANHKGGLKPAARCPLPGRTIPVRPGPRHWCRVRSQGPAVCPVPDGPIPQPGSGPALPRRPGPSTLGHRPLVVVQVRARNEALMRSR